MPEQNNIAKDQLRAIRDANDLKIGKEKQKICKFLAKRLLKNLEDLKIDVDDLQVAYKEHHKGIILRSGKARVIITFIPNSITWIYTGTLVKFKEEVDLKENNYDEKQILHYILNFYKTQSIMSELIDISIPLLIVLTILFVIVAVLYFVIPYVF